MALKAVQAAKDGESDTMPPELDMSSSRSRLIRSNFSCHALPTEVKTWCIVCRYGTICLSSAGVGDNVFLDTTPQWTKGEHAVSVERIPQCINCAPAKTRFVPVVESIPTTSLEQLRAFEMGAVA